MQFPINNRRITIPPVTMVLIVILFFLLIYSLYQVLTQNTLIGQTPNGILPPQNYVKGIVITIIKAPPNDYSTTSTVMDKYKLNYYEIVSRQAGNEHYVEVTVPVGQEQQWIATLKKDPQIVDARFRSPDEP